MSQLYLDRPSSPINTAIFWIEYVARNGNILKSPAVDLGWWQLELLDIYGFILLVLILSIFIICIILRSLFKFMSNILLSKTTSLQKDAIEIKYK